MYISISIISRKMDEYRPLGVREETSRMTRRTHRKLPRGNGNDLSFEVGVNYLDTGMYV